MSKEVEQKVKSFSSNPYSTDMVSAEMAIYHEVKMSQKEHSKRFSRIALNEYSDYKIFIYSFIDYIKENPEQNIRFSLLVGCDKHHYATMDIRFEDKVLYVYHLDSIPTLIIRTFPDNMLTKLINTNYNKEKRIYYNNLVYQKQGRGCTILSLYSSNKLGQMSTADLYSHLAKHVEQEVNGISYLKDTSLPTKILPVVENYPIINTSYHNLSPEVKQKVEKYKQGKLLNTLSSEKSLKWKEKIRNHFDETALDIEGYNSIIDENKGFNFVNKSNFMRKAFSIIIDTNNDGMYFLCIEKNTQSLNYDIFFDLRKQADSFEGYIVGDADKHGIIINAISKEGIELNKDNFEYAEDYIAAKIKILDGIVFWAKSPKQFSDYFAELKQISRESYQEFDDDAREKDKGLKHSLALRCIIEKVEDLLQPHSQQKAK